MKENISMEKDGLEKGKNFIIMAKYILWENIYQAENGMENHIILQQMRNMQ